MDTVQERISMLIVHAGCRNVKAFAKVLGLNPQVLYDIKSGKTREISGRLANKIFLVFPEVNQSWLLNGEGEMLEKSGAPDNGPSGLEDIIKVNLNLSETIRQQQETIHLLTKMLSQRDCASTPKKDIAG